MVEQYNIYGGKQSLLNIIRIQMRAGAAILDQCSQLLKRLKRTISMHSGNRTRVAGIHRFDKFPGFIATQLRQQDTIRLHTQAGRQSLLWRHFRATFIFT